MARKPPRQAGGTPALLVLQAAGVPHVPHPYEHDPGSGVGYGIEAADVLGVPQGQVFKTLVADVDDTLVVAVIPVDRQLDLKALAKVVGGKRAAMAKPDAAERATGYIVGGISPLGQRQPLTTVLDTAIADHETVFVSAGRRGLDVEVGPDDLMRLTAGVIAEISR